MCGMPQATIFSGGFKVIVYGMDRSQQLFGPSHVSSLMTQCNVSESAVRHSMHGGLETSPLCICGHERSHHGGATSTQGGQPATSCPSPTSCTRPGLMSKHSTRPQQELCKQGFKMPCHRAGWLQTAACHHRRGPICGTPQLVLTSIEPVSAVMPPETCPANILSPWAAWVLQLHEAGTGCPSHPP